MICRKCHCQITEVYDRQTDRVFYVVDDGETTTAHGLTYCPPNPDYQGTFGDHIPRKEKAGK